MPIRPDLRHHYRGAPRQNTRLRILTRAEHRCEECGAPNGKTVLRACGWWAGTDSLAATIYKLGGTLYGVPGREIQLVWHHAGIEPARHGFPPEITHYVGIVLTVAHLNHVPGDDRPENLKALCQWCHLNYDKLHHAETRSTRKDATRPLLAVGAAEVRA